MSGHLTAPLDSPIGFSDAGSSARRSGLSVVTLCVISTQEKGAPRCTLCFHQRLTMLNVWKSSKKSLVVRHDIQHGRLQFAIISCCNRPNLRDFVQQDRLFAANYLFSCPNTLINVLCPFYVQFTHSVSTLEKIPQ